MSTQSVNKVKPTKKKVQPTYIHIHAKCDAFEIYEQIVESKAVGRLKSIRQNFHHFTTRYGYSKAGRLVVKTRLINPTLFSV